MSDTPLTDDELAELADDEARAKGEAWDDVPAGTTWGETQGTWEEARLVQGGRGTDGVKP
jgi:hypothetical protein